MKASKEEHLSTLEWFVKQPKLGGLVPSQHFLVLQRRYPLEYVLLMKLHRGDRSPVHDIVDSCLPARINEVNELYFKLHEYLLQTGKKARDDSIEVVVGKLKMLLEKQAREN